MKDNSINNTDKKKVSDFNIEEIRGWIIDKMYNIESNIDFVILDYFNPEKKNEFDRIILNSSIISIGGKLKILRNIKSFDNKVIDKIQKISSIRNAFAHLPIIDNINISFSNDNKSKYEISEINSQLEVMSSNGELKMHNVKELVDNFINLDEEIKKYFQQRQF